MKKSLFFLFPFILLFLSSNSLHAQGELSGKIIDPEGQPLPFATVMLHTASDSSLAKAGYSDESGFFLLSPVPAGEYWLKVTFTGMAAYSSETISLGEGQKLNLPDISLKESETKIREVKILAERPLVQVKPDKTIFNVEGTPNSIGSDAFELLRKAPGVVIDNNDNIMLLGKSGVRVYIDGKPSPLSAADLAAMLKTMQSSEIDAFEIITNPSSKYDAEGNAGIINIKLKKDKNLGGNANLTLGYAIGRFSKYNGSLNGNYRNKKLNAFGSYSYNTGRFYNFINFYRNQKGHIFDQRSEIIKDSDNHNYKAGVDIFINEKSTLGVIVNGFIGSESWDNNSRTPIINQANMETLNVLQAQSLNNGSRLNQNFNLNYRYDNQKDVTWNMDADYGRFVIRNDAFQPNYYYDSTETNILQEAIYFSDTPTDIDILTFKVDHERPLKKIGKLGAGIKTSFVTTDNTFSFYNVINGVNLLNEDRSNNFVYLENVNAAYLNYSGKTGKFEYQAGVRAEQTNSSGTLTSTQVTGNDTVQRNYLNFFPSAGLTYNPHRFHSLRLNYSRRIDRPSYQNLNPFEFKLDELSYRKGNPFLQPQYTQNIQLTHTYKYTLNTTLSYSLTNAFFTNITDTIEQTRSFLTTINLGSREVVNLTVSYPKSITKWLSTFSNVSVFNVRNRANVDDLNALAGQAGLSGLGEAGKEVDIARTSFSVYHQQTYKLPKEFSVQLSGFYNSPSIWGANFLNQKFWGVEAGLMKKFLKGRGNLKLSVSDIFLGMRWRGVQEFGGLYMDASGGWESRQFKVNLSYLFGNDKVKQQRKRKTGLEDESNRAKGGGDSR